jgi:hypothetical protein
MKGIRAGMKLKLGCSASILTFEIVGLEMQVKVGRRLDVQVTEKIHEVGVGYSKDKSIYFLNQPLAPGRVNLTPRYACSYINTRGITTTH